MRGAKDLKCSAQAWRLLTLFCLVFCSQVAPALFCIRAFHDLQSFTRGSFLYALTVGCYPTGRTSVVQKKGMQPHSNGGNASRGYGGSDSTLGGADIVSPPRFVVQVVRWKKMASGRHAMHRIGLLSCVYRALDPSLALFCLGNACPALGWCRPEAAGRLQGRRPERLQAFLRDANLQRYSRKCGQHASLLSYTMAQSQVT